MNERKLLMETSARYRVPTLYVGGLDPAASEEAVRGFFEAHAVQPLSVTLIRDRGARVSRGFAYIEVSAEQVGRCLELDGAVLGGRRLEVDPAR